MYGLMHEGMPEMLEMALDIPSVCADKLERGEVDLALVPVAILPKLKTPYIISDYCIGTIGAVKTVGIYSDVPIEEITELYLDFHSRTSVQLAQILMKEYWNISPILHQAKEGFIEKIEGTVGAVVIGDRAIGLEEKHLYFYDLGDFWMKHTGLPFVFAAWVSNKKLPEEFIEKLNKAFDYGIHSIPELMYILPSPSEDFDLEEYYTKYISYELDAEKKKGLALFLEKLGMKEDIKYQTVTRSFHAVSK
jgi:chorismate dehydratase